MLKTDYNCMARKNTVENPKLIAHRGFTPKAPQNSIPAFQAAGARGFWAIETDVHKTKDGVLVCNHDPAVDCMYNGSGLIREMTYDELGRLRLKAGDKRNDYPEDLLRMPSLREYLAICKEYGSIPFIETKTNDIAAVIEAACSYFPEDQVVLSSLSEKDLYVAREISKKVFVHHIFSNRDTMFRLGELGPSGVSYNYQSYVAFPQQLLHQTHAAGVLLCLRAGDDIETVREMIEMGLDYIPTNCVSSLNPQQKDMKKVW